MARLDECAQRVGHTEFPIPVEKHSNKSSCQTWKMWLLLLAYRKTRLIHRVKYQHQFDRIQFKDLKLSDNDNELKHFIFKVVLFLTCQEKLQSCQLSNIKQVTEDEGFCQKLLWKEPRPLLTLDGNAFCTGFTHLLSLLCTFWLKILKMTEVIYITVIG